MNGLKPYPDPNGRGNRWQQFLHGWLGRAPLSGASADLAPSIAKSSIADKSFCYGNGEAAVLLIHGLTGTPVEMQAVGRGLAKEGFSAYGMQLAGHCGSEDDLLRTGWRDWYGSVEKAWREISLRHENVFVAGLSMGTLMAMHLSVQHPGRIRGLGLYSTTLFYDGWAVPKLAFLLPLFLHTPVGGRYRFIENFPYGIKNERLREFIHASMISGNSEEAGNLGMTGRSLRELRQFISLVKTELSSVHTPALVLQAKEDDVTSPRNSEYLARHLGGPTRVELLHDCYHMITIDQQRDEVVRLSAEFFRSCLVDTARRKAANNLAPDRIHLLAADAHQLS
ncbi:MAG: alpha/beta fold hydrolase [Betaproteobacteria bacterium]|nr:alpha/beta fold hydrolase [Betaproteobacteria bacterium]